MAAQVKEHVGRCHPCLALKARQQKAPLKNIMATQPLELIHLDYLCLEPGKGLEENVLVVTDYFTRYAQPYITKPKLPKWLPKPYGISSLSTMGYLKRSSWIKVKTSKVSWWLTSVSWWGHGKCRLACTICKPMANVKDSIPPWSTCLGPYPRKRSQSGKITLECWFMHITAPKTQLQVQPLLSNVQETISSPHRCHTWFGSMNSHRAKHLLSLYEKYGTAHSGLRKRLRHLRLKNHSNINVTMTS